MSTLSSAIMRLLGRGHPSEGWPLRHGPRGTFVFIHINKCGGTSVGRAIGLPRKQHLTAQQVVQRIGRPAWEKAFRFTFVRNPWDKVLSHYHHRTRTKQLCRGTRTLSFTDWVSCTYGPEKDSQLYDNPTMFLPQVEWLKAADGRIDINVVGRFETIAEDFAQIGRRIGVRKTLPHLNKSSSPSEYRSSYDDRAAQIVADWFSEDIEAFGYVF